MSEGVYSTHTGLLTWILDHYFYCLSQGILTQLRTIFDLIIDFQQAQDLFYQTAQNELAAREHFVNIQKQRTTKVGTCLWTFDATCLV